MLFAILHNIGDLYYILQAVIKENTVCVVAARQNSVLLLWRSILKRD